MRQGLSFRHERQTSAGLPLAKTARQGAPARFWQAVRVEANGDYHLGQVLCVEDDYVIIDFEGEPMRTVTERRAKQSPPKLD
jgi:maltose alpha-D-glucosyltransferase/alpha-amylase